MLPQIEEIKRKRKVLNITQFKLAKLVGVSQSLIAKLESGKLDPSYSNAKKIFLALEKMETSDSKKVKNVMTNKILKVEISDTVKTAINSMKRNGISQLPVFDGKNNVGSLSEKKILDKLASGEKMDYLVNSTIEEVMDGPLPSVDEDLHVKAAAQLLQYSQGLLVLRKGKFIGFVTKADLLKG